MEWTKTLPTEPGRYWVWQAAEVWPCRGEVHMVLVENTKFGMSAWVPFMDFQDRLDLETWAGSWWSGPVDTPAPPKIS